MSIIPKIHTNNQIKSLFDSYINKQMSTVEISNNSIEIFGLKISAGTIYKELIRHKIPIRTKSESVSIATSTLDRNISHLNKSLIEWIDGFLLGDGYIGINKTKKNVFCGSRFCFGSVEKEWVDYAMSEFKSYCPSESKQHGKIRKKAPRLTWSSSTLTHPDIVLQAQRWYGQNIDYKKEVPKDVKITPTSLLLWYLGDGSITNNITATTLQFATCSFSRGSLENILIPKMEKLGLKCRINNVKNDIAICAESIGLFFEIIGLKSPIQCYQYKFEYPQWLKLYRLSEIVKNDKEKWRALYMYKMKKINCIKSPGGGMLLFTEKEVQELKDKLNHNIREVYKDSMNLTKSKELVKLSSIVTNYTERWNARYFMSHGLVEHEKGSKFTKEQVKILKTKLDRYKNKDAIPSYLVNYHFCNARKKGFPYYELTQSKFNKGVDTLKLAKNDIHKEKGLYSWAGSGSQLASYFHPHMFECKRKGKMSAVELYNSDNDFKRAIWKIIALYPNITSSRIREICRNEQASSRINQFPPRVMIAILKELYPRGGITMLDPTHGFGGRLIGSYASGLVSKYIGIDLSNKTHIGAVKMRDWIYNHADNLFGKTPMGIDLIKGDCLQEINNYKNIDFIFTSPPFLDVERYVGVDFETDYNKWINNFIHGFCCNCYNSLKHNGKMGVYLEKIAGHDFPNDFVKIATGIGFMQLEPIRFKMNYGENTRDTKEARGVPVLIFQK